MSEQYMCVVVADLQWIVPTTDILLNFLWTELYVALYVMWAAGWRGDTEFVSRLPVVFPSKVDIRFVRL